MSKLGLAGLNPFRQVVPPVPSRRIVAPAQSRIGADPLRQVLKLVLDLRPREQGRGAERPGFRARLADRAQVDISVATAPQVVERGCRRTACGAPPLASRQGSLAGALRNDALPERATSAQEVPKHLAQRHLLLLVLQPAIDEAGANLPHESGFFAAGDSAVRTSGSVRRLAATRAGFRALGIGSGIFRQRVALKDEGKNRPGLIANGEPFYPFSGRNKSPKTDRASFHRRGVTPDVG